MERCCFFKGMGRGGVAVVFTTEHDWSSTWWRRGCRSPRRRDLAPRFCSGSWLSPTSGYCPSHSIRTLNEFCTYIWAFLSTHPVPRHSGLIWNADRTLMVFLYQDWLWTHVPLHTTRVSSSRNTVVPLNESVQVEWGCHRECAYTKVYRAAGKGRIIFSRSHLFVYETWKSKTPMELFF